MKNHHTASKSILPFLGLLLTFLLSCSSSKPEEISFTLEIRDRQIEGISSPLQIQKNDKVRIFITADEHVTFHLHGYDIKRVVTPDDATTIAFTATATATATATGSFPFTMHATLGSNDHGHRESLHECKAGLPSNWPRPTLSLATEVLSDHEIRVIVHLTDFFMAGTPSGNHGIASGHWHLFVDDELIGMYTVPDVVIPIYEKGHHTLTATLTDNNHCSFDISTSIMVELGSHRGERGEHATHELEIELGRLDVRP